MRGWGRWLFSSLNIKRWLVLVLVAVLMLAVGLSGEMGETLHGFRLELLRPDTLDRIQRRVHTFRFVDFLLIALGGWGVWFGMRRFVFSLLALAGPDHEKEFVKTLADRARRRRGPRIVAIGGGTGLPNLLSGLKEYSSNLTAVVTMADDGGSSGRLRQEMGVQPPGDLRNCLVALAETEPLMGKLFQHRFGKRGGLKGHSFGNIFIAAMAEVTGDFNEAIRQSSKVLAVAGQVLPVTLDHVSLKATLSSGKVISGESKITAALGKIKKLELLPSDCIANPEVLKAIAEADAIVMGPGSLYTSILPNLLVPQVAQAICESKAVKTYVCNVATQPGETDSFRLSDHVKALLDAAGRPGLIDHVLANTETPSLATLKRYEKKGQTIVLVDQVPTQDLGVKVIKARLLEEGSLLRHAPQRLARAIVRRLLI